MKSLAAEGPETPKKMMFLNTASKIHRKLQGLQSGWTQGGSAAGLAAPITFGYHWRPPARTRAPWPAPGFKGLRLTAGRRQRNGRTRSLVVRRSGFEVDACKTQKVCEDFPGQGWTVCNHEFRVAPDVCLFQPPCLSRTSMPHVLFTSPLGPCWAR